MQAHLPLDSGFAITSTVKSVEFVDGLGGSDVGLIRDEESQSFDRFGCRLARPGEVICLSEKIGTSRALKDREHLQRISFLWNHSGRVIARVERAIQ